MIDKKLNIIESMLLDTAIKEVQKGKYNTAAKVLMVLVTEFNYQFAILTKLKHILSNAKLKNQLKLVKSIFQELNSVKKLELSSEQQASLDVFEKSFSSLLEELADMLFLEKRNEIALAFYEASIGFNPENSKASNKYYELWENINAGNLDFRQAAFLPDIDKKKDKGNPEDK